VLEGIKEKITGYFEDKKPVLIYIFGSYARGTEAMESDIDIAVLLEDEIDDMDLYNYKKNLVDILEAEVDLIDLKSANIILQNQIVTKGVNIYCRNELERGEYKYRIICSYSQYKEDTEVVRKSIKERGWVWKK